MARVAIWKLRGRYRKRYRERKNSYLSQKRESNTRVSNVNRDKDGDNNFWMKNGYTWMRNRLLWSNRFHQDHRIENFKELYTKVQIQMGKTKCKRRYKT